MTISRTPEKIAAFCAALSETCNVGKACAAIGVGRTFAYDWKDSDPFFADAWDKAMKRGVVALEDETHRRAFDGVNEPLVHQGQFSYEWEAERDELGDVILGEDGRPKLVRALDADGKPRIATVKKYSDTLAIFLLKAHAPDKYRENSKIELAGSLALTNMTEEEIRAELASLVSGVVVVPQNDSDDASDLV